MLPANPKRTYSEDWVRIGKWNGYLSNKDNRYYPTIEEASLISIKLGIKNSDDYRVKYKLDKKLPSCLANIYGEEWIKIGKWIGFLKLNN